MSGFARKFKRRNITKHRKAFMKEFKKSMAHFKSLVKCSKCHYKPEKGENIDDWHIDQESNNIDLICNKCYDNTEAGEEDD